MKKLVLFGAGKIGRSFIGQLFAVSGYEVVFVDISEKIVSELNKCNEYTIIIKSANADEIIKVGNVRGILGSGTEKVAEEISGCDIAAISVGMQGLPGVIPVLARGLILRHERSGKKPLDIILAENMRNADQFVKKILKTYLKKDYPFDKMVGLIETSIGKMVPIMPQDVQDNDPLLVYAEPYNTLILDKKAFKNPIPEVKGLAPKDNIKAWVDRKSHIHNFGHAAAAYAGFEADPEALYLADILNIASVKEFTRSAMLQSAEILIRKYPGEFTVNDLTEHINDLLYRFENRALGDTVFRVGCDLKRKLHRNDRILSPLIDGVKVGSQVDNILQTFNLGLSFGAKDENGKMFPGDVEFSEVLRMKGLSSVLLNICGLIAETDQKVIDLILSAGLSAPSVKLLL
jgi:mannitol-1-phosphate 5-dehydrogenase